MDAFSKKWMVILVLLLVLPTAVWAQGTVVVQTTDNLNLRAGPTTNADVLTVIPYQMELPALARTADSAWIQTEYQEYSGWVSRRYLVVLEGQVEWLPELFSQEAELGSVNSCLQWSGNDRLQLATANLPTGVTLELVQRLYSVIGSLIPSNDSSMWGRSLRVVFLPETEFGRVYPNSNGATGVMTNKVGFDGCRLQPFDGSFTGHITILVLITGVAENDFGVLGHELAHYFGAVDGANSPRGLADDTNVVGLLDAYFWYHFGRPLDVVDGAFLHRCGNEVCRQVEAELWR